MSEATQEELDRFMSYVDKLPCGCWYWTGGRSRGKGNKKWYGSFWFRGKSIRAHRFAADHIGKFEPLSKGKHRDHLCSFSMCVRPEHLEQVPSEVNQDRKVARRGLTKEAIEAQLPLNPSQLLEARREHKLWPYDEPSYGDATGIETVGYGRK